MTPMFPSTLAHWLGFTPRITGHWSPDVTAAPECLEPGIRPLVLRMAATGMITTHCSCEGHMHLDWPPTWRHLPASLFPALMAESPGVILTTAAELSIHIRMAIFAARNRGQLKSKWQLRSFTTDSPNGWHGNGVTPPIHGVYHLLGIWPDSLLWVHRSRWAKELDFIADLIEKECLAFRTDDLPSGHADIANGNQGEDA